MDLQSTKKMAVVMTVATFLGIASVNSRPALADWTATGLTDLQTAEIRLVEAVSTQPFELDVDTDYDEVTSFVQFVFAPAYYGQTSEEDFIHVRTREAPSWVTTLAPLGSIGSALVEGDFSDGTMHSKEVQLGETDNSSLNLSVYYDESKTAPGFDPNHPYWLPFEIDIESYAETFFDDNLYGAATAQVQLKSESLGASVQ